jgi:hypothetical protein
LKIIHLTLLIILSIFLSACSEMNQLSRVDVQVLNTDERYDESVIIADKEQVDLLRKAFKRVEWDTKSTSAMERPAGVKATLFFDYDKNMPEKLEEYLIWFNENGTAIIINPLNKDEYDFGTLNKENAQVIKEVLGYQ